METLSARFAEESSLELHSFLSNDLAESLEPRLRERDAKDGLGEDREGHIPPHSAGAEGDWLIKGPPHKWRYCALKPVQEGAPAAAVSPRAAHVSSDAVMRSLQDELFPSAAFRAWMSIVSCLLPTSYSAEARRFRPGLDYTLATSDEKDVRLDVVLGLTPGVKERLADDSPDDQKALESLGDVRGWQAAEWGGWEASPIVYDPKYILIFCLSVIWPLIMKKTTLPYIGRAVQKSRQLMATPPMTATECPMIPGKAKIMHRRAAPTALKRDPVLLQWMPTKKWRKKMKTTAPC